MEKAEIGIVGLGAIGENLALNIESKGFKTAVYNRSAPRLDAFINGRGRGKNIEKYYELQELAAALSTPRKIIIVVAAGQTVDEIIGQLSEVLEEGDVIIDAGNSNYKDTIRRTSAAHARGLLYVGAGIDGGEHGALHGPSIVMGGSPLAQALVMPVFQAIAAKRTLEAGANGQNVPYCTWVGESGAGHFVKMVHNGIEYGDMQLICEAYDIMKTLLGLSCEEIADVFQRWNEGKLKSYLTAITGDILRHKDSDGSPLIEKILDTAGQKGTGTWTAIAALELQTPLTLVAEAVFLRYLSASKAERVRASRIFSGPRPEFTGNSAAFIDDLENALYAAKTVSYAQSFLLVREAAKEYKWQLDSSSIADMWMGGGVIRSAFLGKVKQAFTDDADLKNLLLSPYFTRVVEDGQTAWRTVVSAAVSNGIPTPALASALAYFDAYRREQLPANLVQAQRDYFGAHTYERLDKPRGEFFHTAWTQQSRH
ncbi:MAG: decarboxylating NADP(+)-dependent phosphogluconate dehydrogenase [Treponema sp.]|nr:decarboxylating NADP(+)-dependent phosphogluconate dehydrogenase [Treponema sp.]